LGSDSRAGCSHLRTLQFSRKNHVFEVPAHDEVGAKDGRKVRFRKASENGSARGNFGTWYRTVVHRCCAQEFLDALIARSSYQLMVPMLDQLVDSIYSNNSLHLCTYGCLGITPVRSGKRSGISRQRGQGDQVRPSRIAHERHSLRIGLQVVRFVSHELYRCPSILNGFGITWLHRL
jgi:hypothetical protein